LFRSSIKVLECEPETNYVLVTTELNTHSLHVVERVQSYTYALCKLSAAVTATDVQFLSEAMPTSHATTFSRNPLRNGGQWWEDAVVVLPTTEQMNGHAQRKAPRLSIYEPPDKELITINPTLQTDDHDQQVDEILQNNLQPTSQEDIFESLLTQYLEMLYRSRTSLAYFAKGPISRTRANFGSSAPHATQDLVDFYNSLVMSSTMADKKHREVLPDLIKDLPLTTLSDHEKGTSKSKRKKKKKLKLDKKGLIPDETEHFIHWWKDDETSVISGESIDQRFKRRSLALRTRETFLQIILILEILALDSSDNKGSSKESAGETAASDEHKPKTRKTKDQNLVLEILLDKLTIWHSLDSGPIASEAKKESSTRSVSNQLADFCVEVIIPFYSSRIPETAAIVNKKLGGPTAPSPVKAKSKSRKPGDQETRRPSEKKSRDSLHRVSSERLDQNLKGVPSLQRSSTDSVLMPHLKRETSEIPLDQIPRKMSQPQPPRGMSVLDKNRIRQREVDFSALSQAQEAKKKKQADVEQKLRDAISGLRKPNRDVASKALTEATEQRQIIAQARAKASQLQRQRSSNNVQIDATPKHGRVKMITATPDDHRYASAHVPSSSSVVPSSSMRPPPEMLADDEVPQTGHRPNHMLIQSTPTRDHSEGSMKPSMPTVRPFALAPNRSATAVAVPTTPSKGKMRSLETEETPEKDRIVDFVVATPVKSRVEKDVEIVQGAERGLADDDGHDWNDGTNIYAALGWE